MKQSREQCGEVVWRRDTYRRTGRGKTRFEMHYQKGRCSRYALPGELYCRQHLKISGTCGRAALSARDGGGDAE